MSSAVKEKLSQWPHTCKRLFSHTPPECLHNLVRVLYDPSSPLVADSSLKNASRADSDADPQLDSAAADGRPQGQGSSRLTELPHAAAIDAKCGHFTSLYMRFANASLDAARLELDFHQLFHYCCCKLLPIDLSVRSASAASSSYRQSKDYSSLPPTSQTNNSSQDAAQQQQTQTGQDAVQIHSSSNPSVPPKESTPSVASDTSAQTPTPALQPAEERSTPVEAATMPPSLIPLMFASVPPLDSPGAPRQKPLRQLASRVRSMESNMALSMRYLEELSQRYRRQIENLTYSTKSTARALVNLSVRAAECADKNLALHTELVGLRDSVQLLKTSNAQLAEYIQQIQPFIGSSSLRQVPHTVLYCVHYAVRL